MGYYRTQPDAFDPVYLTSLAGQILACEYFAVNNLNRDFVGTRGFSVVFRHEGLDMLARQFPFFLPYLEQALEPGCNAFYLNPLLMRENSRVDPHIDRSLRSYCKTVEPPATVSVLYVQVPVELSGGELVLRTPRRQVGQIRPQANTLLHFQGDLTHSVNALKTAATRLSLVCEQYILDEPELEQIPVFTIESRSAAQKRLQKTLT